MKTKVRKKLDKYTKVIIVTLAVMVVSIGTIAIIGFTQMNASSQGAPDNMMGGMTGEVDGGGMNRGGIMLG